MPSLQTNRARQRQFIMLLLSIALPACLLLALVIGTVKLPITEILQNIFNFQDTINNKTQLIVNQIRLPRALLAALIGALLAVCGTATQGLFRNPLADPSLIGVTSGASAGASLMIVFGASITANFNSLAGLSLVSFGAFIGGVCTVFVVYRLATSQTGTSVATMLLAGIAITALAGGLTSLLEFSANNEMLRRISLWRMGGLDGASYIHVMVAILVSSFILFALPAYSTALNALLLGESEAQHLGINVQQVKIRLVLLVAAGVGTAVALAGSIAFVGLVVPHMMRLLLGPNHKTLLPASAIAGAILLLLADTFARTIIAPTELPVGLVTAIIGAPFFISLLRHRHEYGMQ